MKRNLFYILFLFSLVGFSQADKVTAKIDTTAIRIGEQFVYAISVNDTENVILPKLDNLKGLEVVDTLKVDTLKNKLIQKFVLTGFDSGAFYIPRQQVFVKNQAYLTDSLLVNVATVAVDTTKIKQFPIKGIKSEPLQFDDFKNLIYWIVGLLILIGALIYFFVIKKKKEEVEEVPEILLSPIEEAIQNLSSLDEKLLWQNNKIKQYYSELTEVIRHYIEREVKISAMENTSNELVDTLSDLQKTEAIIADKETIQQLNKLLQQSDLVKFAKSKPLSYEIEGDRKVAEFIIKNIKIKPVVVAEEDTEDAETEKS